MIQSLDSMRQIREYASAAQIHQDGILNLCHQIVGLSTAEDEEMPDSVADSVEFLRFFIDAAPVLAVELVPGVQDPIMIRTTKTLENLFGYAPGQLNGQPISILIPPDKRDQHMLHIRKFLEHPTDRQMGADVYPEGYTISGDRFPIAVVWTRFFVERRQFLAATIMPQLEDAHVANLQAEIESLKARLTEVGN